LTTKPYLPTTLALLQYFHLPVLLVVPLHLILVKNPHVQISG